MCVQLKTEVYQVTGHWNHLWSVDVTTNEETRVWSGQFETVDREESSPVRLMNVFTKRSDFTSRCHFDTTKDPFSLNTSGFELVKLTGKGLHLEDESKKIEEP